MTQLYLWIQKTSYYGYCFRTSTSLIWEYIHTCTYLHNIVINESTEVLNPRRYAWMNNIVVLYIPTVSYTVSFRRTCLIFFIIFFVSSYQAQHFLNAYMYSSWPHLPLIFLFDTKVSHFSVSWTKIQFNIITYNTRTGQEHTI